MANFSAVILAAGQGKRTGLPYPKVLHPLCGKPMLQWVVETIQSLNPRQTVVIVSPEHQDEIARILGSPVETVVQEKPLGTGDALRAALPGLRIKKGTVLVACGDTPLIPEETFQTFLSRHQQRKAAATLLTAIVSNPEGYGRVLRNRNGQVRQILEEKDAPERAKKIKEINTGTYCFELDQLLSALPQLTRKNAQEEYYLTDCIGWLVKKRKKVFSFSLDDGELALGVNTLKELGAANQRLNEKIKEKWLEAGVIFVQPESVYVDAPVFIGKGTVLYPFTILEGKTNIGVNSQIGPFTRIVASRLGQQVVIQNSVLVNAEVGDRTTVGPFAYLRPGTRLDSDVKVGDFVEVKNSTVGAGSKVPHLSYVGDATIGKNVNIGAGVITCNYDGKGKYSTQVEDGAFIGSGTKLVAPVRIGQNAITGAGAVVTEDVKDGTVVVGVPARPIKKREEIHGG